MMETRQLDLVDFIVALRAVPVATDFIDMTVQVP